MKKISIVMAYYNRAKLLKSTLATIAKSSYPNFEVIVMDDASRKEERVEYLQQQYPFLRVFRVEEDEKWYINPCIAYNKAIAKATGDIIIIQNPALS